MAGRHWYKVVDRDTGETVFEGMRKDICDTFGLDDHYFYQVRTHGYAFKNSYYIEDMGLKKDVHPSDMSLYKEQLEKKKQNEQRWNFKPKKEKKKTPLENIKWHLDIYGNTITYKNPKKIIEELEGMGYKLKVVHEPKRVIRHRESKVGEVFSECWIISKEKQEKSNYVI